MIRYDKRKYYPSKTILNRKMSCSATVEAALAIPFFLMAIVTLIYLFELMSIQTSVRTGLQYAEKAIAEEGYVKTMVSPGKIQQYVESEIGYERLNRSIVEGGISCKKSYISSVTGTGVLRASYQVRIPVPFYSLHSNEMTVSMKCKLWCGYEKNGIEKEDEDIVYVTETGVVYHKDYNCTYLDLSIHMVSGSTLDQSRNKSGGKYHACEYCHPSGGGVVYVTDYGDRYHSSLSCSGLKRTVYSVPISEVIGKGACSKCSK